MFCTRTIGLLVTAGLLATAGLLRAQDTTNQPPLPQIEDVLNRITERAAQEDDEHGFKSAYSYHRTKVKEIRNGDGELQKREEKNRVHVPKIDQTDSNADEDDGDDVPVVQDEEQAATDMARSGRGKAFEKSDFALTEELLSRFTFKLVGRESIGDRQTLVIDFRPATGDLPENGIKDKFINRAAGRVWVDEEDYALVNADLHLTERVNIVGGLVGAVWKFKFQVKRERTEEGFWFVRKSEWHLEGRQVLVHRTIDYHEEKSDVKKYSFPVKPQAGLTTQ